MKPWPVLEESYWNSSIFASIKIIEIHTSRLPFERTNSSSDHSLCTLSIRLKTYTAYISLKKCTLINSREVHPNLIWPSPQLLPICFNLSSRRRYSETNTTILQQKLSNIVAEYVIPEAKAIVPEALGVERDFWNSLQSVVSAYLTQALSLEAVCKNSHIFVSYKFSSFFTSYSIPLQKFFKFSSALQLLKIAWWQNCSYWKLNLWNWLSSYILSRRKRCLTCTVLMLMCYWPVFSVLSKYSFFPLKVLFSKNNPVNLLQQLFLYIKFFIILNKNTYHSSVRSLQSLASLSSVWDLIFMQEDNLTM